MIFSIMITVLKGKIKFLMLVSTGIMLAGNGAMAAATLDNLPGVYAAVSFACLGVGAVIIPCQVVSTVVSQAHSLKVCLPECRILIHLR